MKLATFLGAAAAVALSVLTYAVPAARAATISTLFNTGVGATGTSLPDGTSPDPHYSLVFVPDGVTITLVRTSAGGFPIPPYLPDSSVSAWIGPNNAPDLHSPAGLYDYQTTFSLAGFDPSTAVITGRWSSDNAGVAIGLNGTDSGAPGNPYGSDPNFSFQHWVSFTINSGFVAGLNTLDFFVFNGNGETDTDGPTALRVEMIGEATATPLPATWTMMLIGFFGFGFFAFRGMKNRSVALATV